MADLKPVDLIHGDDHGAVAERRAGLRRLVEGKEGSVELLEGDQATPAGAAGALAAMTLALGWRVILVDGAERWRAQDIEAHLGPALAAVAPNTTLAIFAREEARAKVPPSLAELVKKAGGQVVAQLTVKPWELAKWAREQAARMGLSLDAAAAKALVSQVGERQQRLLRELEKLALERDPAADASVRREVSVEEVEALTAHSAEWRAYGLADALVGAETREATLLYLHLRHQGERIAGLTYLIAGRLREALSVSLRLQCGESAAEIKRTLRMPARAAERLIADVARSEPERLRAALGVLADLELDSRGGALLLADRGKLAGMQEDTLAHRAIEAVAAGDGGLSA
jgi:DNA polymerase-3 subunit delta